MAPRTFHVETLGCPKNAVDSDKVIAALVADGLVPAAGADEADLVVVNTCAFVEAARQESIEVSLALAEQRKPGAQLVVTGCMAERYGDELAGALCPRPTRSSGSPARAVAVRARRRSEAACVTCSSCPGRRRRRRGRT